MGLPHGKCIVDCKDVDVILTEFYQTYNIVEQANTLNVEEFAQAHLEFLCGLLGLIVSPIVGLVQTACAIVWCGSNVGRVLSFAAMVHKAISQARNSQKAYRTGESCSLQPFGW